MICRTLNIGTEINDLEEWEVTKVERPNKGHILNNGRRPMCQDVHYLETTVLDLLKY